MSKKITIELFIPDDAGNDAVDLCTVAREIFHKNFKGDKDYIASSVAVWDDRIDNKTCKEVGLSIDYTSCVDKRKVANDFVNAFTDLVRCPEYCGMVFGDDEADIPEDDTDLGI